MNSKQFFPWATQVRNFKRGYKAHYHKIRKQFQFVLAYHSCKHISKVVSNPYNSHIQIVFKSMNLWQHQNSKEM